MIFNLEGRLPTKDEMEAMEKEVERLVIESRDWRGAVNACWALWGIVQAVIPGLVVNDDDVEGGDNDGETKSLKSEEDGEEFDYVKYAEQKAMLFWGDMVGLGVVSEEEVKEWSGAEDVKGKLKWLPV